MLQTGRQETVVGCCHGRWIIESAMVCSVLAPEILSGSPCPAHVQNPVSTRVCMWQLRPTRTASPDSLSGSIIYPNLRV